MLKISTVEPSKASCRTRRAPCVFRARYVALWGLLGPPGVDALGTLCLLLAAAAAACCCFIINYPYGLAEPPGLG